MKLIIICSIAAVASAGLGNYEPQNYQFGPVVNIPYGSNQYDSNVGYQQNYDAPSYSPVVQDYGNNYNSVPFGGYQQQGLYDTNGYENVNQYNQNNIGYGYRNKNKIIVSNQGPPVLVNQPQIPTINVPSGPASVVKTNPVFFKQSPGYIVKEETIHKHPSPVSLNPVYVKVFKPQPYDNYGSTSDGYGNNGADQSYGNISPLQSYGNYNTDQSYGNINSFPSYGNLRSDQSYGNISPFQSYGNLSPDQAYGNISPVQDYGSYSPVQSYGNISPIQSYGNQQY